jgi:hypothetical protein
MVFRNTITGLFAIIVVAGICLFTLHCSKDSTGPDNSPPIIDSIIADPDMIHPGADIILTAVAHDPDGDSITYHWSTYPKAGVFGDTTAQTTMLTVSTALKGGMSMKITLTASDNSSTASAEKWISIIAGKVVWGYIFFYDTRIPVPGVPVAINRLTDTSDYRGYYKIDHVPPGQRIIETSQSGCDEYSAEILVEDSTRHDITLNCGQFTKAVSGKISTADLLDLENVRVKLLNPDSTGTTIGDVTDQYGQFVITGVPPGKRLFAIEDAGGVEYQVLSDTFEISVRSDTTIDIRGRTRRVVFVSDGISHPEAWLLQDNQGWGRWFVDSLNGCFGCNWCQVGGLRKMKMANAIPIPSDAKSVSWTLDVGLVDVVCEIGYLIDDDAVNSELLGIGTANLILDEPALLPGYDAAGHNFAVEFYSWNRQSDSCSSICLRRFTLSYYK